jgi:hypothetical protein
MAKFSVRGACGFVLTAIPGRTRKTGSCAYSRPTAQIAVTRPQKPGLSPTEWSPNPTLT